jgi:hypothetical protein
VTTTADPPVTATERSAWRAVALPSEHGGWGLTLEPVLLGSLLAPSRAGAALGAAAFLAFHVRTPTKLVAVDLRRRRWLPRTRTAALVAVPELLLLGVLVALAARWSSGPWWLPLAAASPLVAVEGWYEVRSRGRRLVPELCGAVGVASSAAAIVLAGGGDGRLAVGAWAILAARALGAIPFVRSQIVRARRHVVELRGSDTAQLLAVGLAGAAVVVEPSMAAGAIGVALLSSAQFRWARRDPPPIKVLGIRQMALGLALVAVTAAGAALI